MMSDKDNIDKDRKEKDNKEGDNEMENVIDFKEYSSKENIEDYSIIDMILNPEKRARVQKYFDEHYKDTEEEKQIFEAWKKRRTRSDD